jgi:glutathione synthase/RimK-type ligase-like ATP-grasp enzyme
VKAANGKVIDASTLGFLTDSLWVSEPEATRIANRKPLQLKVARDVGFQIPLTCISNDPIEVQAFLLRNSGVDMIIKAVGSSYIRLTHSPEDKSRKNRAIYTRLINRDSFLSNIHRVSICPFILQEAIHKESDIRITVVGDRVFASEICIEQNVDPYNLDWRHHKVVRVYRSHNLPKSIIESSVKVVRSLGLRFGCIDMGYSRKTGYTFFEINPQGQWMPSEQIVGHPISLALAKLLIN